jgi:uncharacterized RDD family membrane protein YckC
MVDPNPYAPPRAGGPDAEPPLRQPDPPASRERRLAGAAIDAILQFAVGVTLSHLYAGLIGQPRSTREVTACIIAATTVQWALVGWRGQTVGKILVKTRIALANGDNPGFFRGVVLRAWPFFLLQMAPSLLGMQELRGLVWFPLMGDLLMIFRRDVRCLHDHLAGTYVVGART